MNEKLYNVGSYIRLSIEGAVYGSESVENQREMLSQFIAHMPCWIDKCVYVDDGASGGNFNRNGFQDMMTDVRSGEVNLVLVQDLSRFGRNYLEAGRYLEEELPSLGCRFVSLMDGIDTETGENDIMPLLNAMHDLHLKNLSERVKSVLLAKAKAGHKLGRAPYGYKKEANDPTKLIIDDYAAEVVKRIYDMRLSGMGYASIVKALNTEVIIPPLVYYFNLMGFDDSKIKARSWLTTAVKRILNYETSGRCPL
jgi:DNA invertase Pin-like site-specific DNA recombinase